MNVLKPESTKDKIVRTCLIIVGLFVVVGLLEAVKLGGALEITAADIIALFLIGDTWVKKKQSDKG